MERDDLPVAQVVEAPKRSVLEYRSAQRLIISPPDDFDSYLIQAIVVTIWCPPVGIFALGFAIAAEHYYRNMDYIKAIQFSRWATRLCYLATVIVAIWMVGLFTLVFLSDARVT